LRANQGRGGEGGRTAGTVPQPIPMPDIKEWICKENSVTSSSRPRKWEHERKIKRESSCLVLIVEKEKGWGNLYRVSWQDFQ
jgi:hypothetical protein